MSVSDILADASCEIRDCLHRRPERYKQVEKQFEKVLVVMDAMRLALDVVPGDRREELILSAFDDLDVEGLRKLLTRKIKVSEIIDKIVREQGGERAQVVQIVRQALVLEDNTDIASRDDWQEAELDYEDTEAFVREQVGESLRLTALSMYEALQGYWDYAGHPDGFEALKEHSEQALTLLGLPLPDYAARDREAKEEE